MGPGSGRGRAPLTWHAFAGRALPLGTPLRDASGMPTAPPSVVTTAGLAQDRSRSPSRAQPLLPEVSALLREAGVGFQAGWAFRWSSESVARAWAPSQGIASHADAIVCAWQSTRVAFSVRGHRRPPRAALSPARSVAPPPVVLPPLRGPARPMPRLAAQPSGDPLPVAVIPVAAPPMASRRAEYLAEVFGATTAVQQLRLRPTRRRSTAITPCSSWLCPQAAYPTLAPGTL